jgi:hypothetical protein
LDRRAQVAHQQTIGSEFSQFFQSLFIILDVSDEIADNLDLIGIVIRDLDAREFIFDQYHQLQTIEPADAEIVTEVRFIYNPFGINETNSLAMLKTRKAFQCGLTSNDVCSLYVLTARFAG